MIKFQWERHDLGFYKVSARILGYGIRLHIWSRKVTEDRHRHDHTWNFVSIPLWGKFREIRWNLTPDAGTSRRYEWTVDHRAGDAPDETKHLDQLTIATVHTRRAFVPYHCPQGAIHSHWALGDGFHASLVFTGRQKVRASRIWPAR